MRPSIPAFLPELVERSRAEDGQPPFSEQSLVELARGERQLLVSGAEAAAVVGLGGDGPEFELVVDPAARRQGLGGALAARTIAEAEARWPDRPLHAWAHGDHPGGAALAARHGFEAVRTLLQLRRELDANAVEKGAEDASPPPGFRLRAFEPVVDGPAWLALNARAFADHPEQGALTAADLDDRIRQDWFDAENLLLLENADGELVGFDWLKVEDGLGEIYAIAVSPDAAGQGLGRVLLTAGLARLRTLGIRTVALYVEADNAPALALYERYGFARHSIDVRYRRG